MAICVKLSATGVIELDPSCSSGFQILTKSEIDAINSISHPDSERISDITSLFYAFLLVLVVVWGLKQLLNLFTGDIEK